MDNAMILGYGVVGKATAIAYDIHNHYDLNDSLSILSDFYANTSGIYRFYFICVPTPTVNSKQDVQAIEDVIRKVKDNGYDKKSIFVLRSTVLPGTTSWLEKHHEINIVHFPEFLTEKSAIPDEIEAAALFGFNDIEIGHVFAEQVFDKKAPHWFKPESTELSKYALNTFFATKVILGNMFKDMAIQFNADYEVVKDLLEGHKWGSVNGWDPFRGNHRGFGGKCLPKDVTAISEFDKTGLLKKLLEVNEKYAKV